MQREAGMESLVENPFGYGLGASGYIGRRETGSLSAVTDNWYIKTAQELGLVGLGLYVVLFGALMLRFFAAGVDNRAATLSLALLGGSLFMAYGSNYFDFDFQAAVFWILSGYAVNETAYPDRLAADESRDLSRDCH
jgi:O-antigen ligase